MKNESLVKSVEYTENIPKTMFEKANVSQKSIFFHGNNNLKYRLIFSKKNQSINLNK